MDLKLKYNIDKRVKEHNRRLKKAAKSAPIRRSEPITTPVINILHQNTAKIPAFPICGLSSKNFWKRLLLPRQERLKKKQLPRQRELPNVLLRKRRLQRPSSNWRVQKWLIRPNALDQPSLLITHQLIFRDM
eukprot:Blabericola_migrator_1__7600@NODE_3885_length_1449_cov_18_887120_g2404_i0_p1_GENE_NODE_3885_length_1449_cov_18_887120_g2404_i0NODE_3885_length_1449_cov_18_887120_g2404_i0_p1_ORF_typecomplete_len132_score9_29GN3L_Grn1/PF08701_11/4_8e06GN3L_Grn1/PF08701_11/3_8e03_NODE_3885_length_1449_cov_18_887120_g2404_i08961291